MSVDLLRWVIAGLVCSITLVAYGAANGEEPTRLKPTVVKQRLQRQLREEVQPVDMRADGGVGYLARLRLGREGDRDSDSSLCVLLEDGKPLPHPRSRHAAIREKGEGRYSHWTASQLYFSASDSSDPRTNGRKYELVSQETFVRKTAQVTATTERSSFNVAAPQDARVRPVRLVLRNLDPQAAVIPRLIRRGDPDLTSAKAMVKSITTDDMTDEQRAIAIWKFLVQWRYHDYPAEQRGEVHDPVKLINVYGYGFCDDSAAAFCALAAVAGMKTRSYGLSGHVVAEAFYDDGWHMFDPDHEVFYRTDDGRIASVAELEQRPELITRTPRDPIGFPSERLARVYTSRADNRPFQAVSGAPSTLRPVLEPSDRIVFDFLDRRKVHRRAHLEKPWPKSFGNGILIQKRSLHKAARDGDARMIRVKWPYVVLSGQIEFPPLANSDRFTVSATVDRRTFDRLDINSNADVMDASLDAWIDSQPSAVYDYWLRIRCAGAADPAEVAKRITLKTTFQFAPRALAQVKPGENEFEVYLDFNDKQPGPDAFGGVQVELVWDELVAK